MQVTVSFEVDEPHNILMRQATPFRHFLLQRPHCFRVGCKFRRQDLDGDIAFIVTGICQSFVDCLVDGAHAAALQQLLQQEAAADQRADLWRATTRLVPSRARAGHRSDAAWRCFRADVDRGLSIFQKGQDFFGFRLIQHFLNQFDTLQLEITCIESILQNFANLVLAIAVIGQQSLDQTVHFRHRRPVVQRDQDQILENRKLPLGGWAQIVGIVAHVRQKVDRLPYLD